MSMKTMMRMMTIPGLSGMLDGPANDRHNECEDKTGQLDAVL